MILRDKIFTSEEWKKSAEIGRARRNLARKLVEKAEEYEKIAGEKDKSLETGRVRNKNVENKLLDSIENQEGLNIEVGDKNMYDIKNKKISYKSGDVDSLAHEYGHALNRINNSPTSAKVDKFSKEEVEMKKNRDLIKSSSDVSNRKIMKTKNIRLSFGKPLSIGEYKKKAGEKEKSLEQYKDEIDNHLKIRKTIGDEESDATRRGLEELRKAGATEDEINLAKENLSKALSTYKDRTGRNLNYLLANAVQIPSRKL